MRPHAIAAALAGASALAMVASCGETLPATEDLHDAGAEASTDAGDANDDASDDVVADADAGCTSAPCNVEEVASARPAAIAASTAAMIWLETATVFRLDPGKPPAIVMQPPNGATGYLAIDGTTALMTESSGVRRCGAKAGGCTIDDPAAPIYGLAETGPIATAEGEIYAAERSGSNRIVTCGLQSNCGDLPSVVAYLPGIPKKMALTSSSVVVGLEDQTIRAYLRAGRLDGGALQPPPLATVVDLRGLTADGAEVYWADAVSGTIGRCTVETCSTTTKTLATGRSFPRAVAVSAGMLYWVETNADAVVRCTLPGCADVTVIARVPKPSDLTVGDRVYVSSDSAQKIYATPR